MFRALIFLAIVFALIPRADAQQIFETTFKGRALFCAVSDGGEVVSGRMRKGNFRRDVALTRLRKKVRKARKSGDSELLKVVKRKARTAKARLAVCTREFTPEEPIPEEPIPEEPPVVPPGSDGRRGNEISSAELFSCDGSPQPSEPRIRRIGQMEWAATLGLRGTDAEFNPLVPDAGSQYSTFSDGASLNDTVLSEYFNYLRHTRTGWIDGSSSSNVPRPPEHRCMILPAPPSETCIRAFLQVYLKNFVLFREPKPGELDRLAVFASEAVAANVDRSTQAARSAVMEQITSAAWVTSGALFRSEIGQGEQLSSGETLLADEELGKAIAYTFTNQGPGAPRLMQPARVFPPLPRVQAIEDAVLDGTISVPATLDALVAANYSGIDELRDPHYSEYWMGEKIEQFFIEWLGISGLPTSFHDRPSATADVTGLVRVDESYNHMKKKAYYGDGITLGEQAIEMIARIVDSDQDVISSLFTSRQFYLPSNLESQYVQSPQAVYGVREDLPSNREALWNILPANERAGILTHPAWLAAHADNFENGPSAILRGKWIRENVLCGMVPDVPITVDASFPPSTSHLSARERLQLSTGSPSCQGCHSLMNPLGLPFEMYNHAGFVRATDHGSAPSGESTIVFSGDDNLNGPVVNAVEFSERLANSPVVEQCFIRQVFRYLMGRPESNEDACTLTMMQNVYEDSGGSMKSMVQALVRSPTFTMRKESPAEE